MEGIEPREGVRDLLAFLDVQSWPWAIYTSADAELTRVRLAAAGVKPPVLVTRDQVADGKPAPDGYLRAADLLDIPADGCIVIEDTDVGLAAGRAAGMAIGIVGDSMTRASAAPAIIKSSSFPFIIFATAFTPIPISLTTASTYRERRLRVRRAASVS